MPEWWNRQTLVAANFALSRLLPQTATALRCRSSSNKNTSSFCLSVINFWQKEINTFFNRKLKT